MDDMMDDRWYEAEKEEDKEGVRVRWDFERVFEGKKKERDQIVELSKLTD